MVNTADILETINMIRQENLDIRTITMGISLLDCVSDPHEFENKYGEDEYSSVLARLSGKVIEHFMGKVLP